MVTVLVTDRSIQREQYRYGIFAVVPASVESQTSIATFRREGTIGARIVRRDGCPALRHIATPGLRDRLPVSESPGQCPAVKSNCAVVLDGNGRIESSRLFTVDGIDNLTRTGRAYGRSSQCVD